MPAQWRIAIRKQPSGPPAYDPNPLNASTLDQIFFANEDTVAHWPCRRNADGSVNRTFFMPNQIAPNGDVSAIWSSANPGTFEVVCCLHPNERATIVVT